MSQFHTGLIRNLVFDSAKKERGWGWEGWGAMRVIVNGEGVLSYSPQSTLPFWLLSSFVASPATQASGI